MRGRHTSSSDFGLNQSRQNSIVELGRSSVFTPATLLLLEAGALCGALSQNIPSPLADVRLPAASRSDYVLTHAQKREIFLERFYRLPFEARTDNFQVRAKSTEIAERIAQKFEAERSYESRIWFGKELPDWPEPCKISVFDSPNGFPGGSTSFVFDNGTVFDFQTEVTGRLDLVESSCVSHEAVHMVFASHFLRPVPRWADEGAAMMLECPSERERAYGKFRECMRLKQIIPLSELLAITDYPPNVWPLYCEGGALTNLFVALGGGGLEGRQKFTDFLRDIIENPARREALIKEHYGYESIEHLEGNWTEWVAAHQPGNDVVPQTCVEATEPYGPDVRLVRVKGESGESKLQIVQLRPDDAPADPAAPELVAARKPE